MTTKSTFRDSTFKPDDVVSVANRVDGHSCRIVVNTTQYQIHISALFASIQSAIGDMVVALGSGDVHVVGLDLNLWVDELEGLLGGFNL